MALQFLSAINSHGAADLGAGAGCRLMTFVLIVDGVAFAENIGVSSAEAGNIGVVLAEYTSTTSGDLKCRPSGRGELLLSMASIFFNVIRKFVIVRRFAENALLRKYSLI